MQFYLWKKRFYIIVVNLIGVNVILMPIFILLLIASEWGMAAIFATPLVIMNAIFVLLMPSKCPTISFEENSVKCTFNKKVRREILYTDIKDYVLFLAGTYQLGTAKFIGLSRNIVPESQRDDTMYSLYSKTKDVIILEYNEKARDFIKEKCPHLEIPMD